MTAGCGIGFWTATSTILVLYILLVIILRAPLL
ncbi:YjcZ family sporulation protein [Paenibacillus profundus]|uniref:YjcZ family sporulation protein n=1 Tax=Paenibacillus profundus TaxID=1173085 RepID=A0ABS8YHY0_9BACL|nr:YjcZ family sporulation protein [Paenibacillus sp. OSY-SE]MCE5171538.1 YjcZ family sporulation protein [Paenibacillus profundus]